MSISTSTDPQLLPSLPASTSTVSPTSYGLETIEDQIILGNEDIRVIAVRVIDGALGFLGVIFLLMVLYGGLLWLTSGGKEEKTSQAKRTSGNALIGLIIIFMSYSILRFIFGALTSATGTIEPL